MLVLLYLLITAVSCSTLNGNIYTSIDFGDIHCFRMNNFNSQTGCQTSRDGDNGVLYPFISEDDVENVLQDLNKPIIPVLTTSLFNNKTAVMFVKYGLTKGMIVVEDDVIGVDAFSPQKSCPGTGFNYGESADDLLPRQCVSKSKWNPDGNWLSYYDFPFGVYIIKSKSQKEIINEKAEANMENGSLKPYPLWGGEVKAFMNAARNTETCMRRGTCDPVSGLNINVNLVPKAKENMRQIILFVTKADANAFFKDLSFGGKDSGASVAVLLGVIKALSNVRDNDKNNDFNILTSEFMLTFLQAESFDYSGSQRLAYDLKRSNFGKGAYNISLSDVKCIIEIGPISMSNELYLHSRQSGGTVKQVQELFAKYGGAGKNFTFTNVDDLPPSSLNSFLREDNSTPGVLLTDGEDELLSHVYGSRLDILDNSNELSTRMKALIEVIGNVALQLAGGVESVEITIEESLVTKLLDCILVNQNCTLLQSILNRTNLENERLSRYSSVGPRPSNYTIYLTYLASDFSKKKLDLSKEECNLTHTGGWSPYIRNNTCYGIAINSTYAKSPAFLLKQYDSTKYSTWTESRWSPNFRIRLFLVASQSENILLFCCGLLYFIVMSAFIFQCHRRSDQLFLGATSHEVMT